MDKSEIAKWLKGNKTRFQVIAIESGVSVPTLYSLSTKPKNKRQQRIVDSISNYIAAQPNGKK
jgi:hypothetical protein